MATDSSRRVTLRPLAIIVAIVIALIAIPICAFGILYLVDFTRTAIIGLPDWIDVEMGELSPGVSKQAHLDIRADNHHSGIRHIYSYAGHEGQTLHVRVVPGNQMLASIEIEKDLHFLASTPPPDTKTPSGASAELSVNLPENGVYRIIIVGIRKPDNYEISIEVTEPQG